MYVPRHWHQALPVATSLIGFYLLHNLVHTYDVVIVFCTLQLLALGHEVWIILLSHPYQRYITWVNTPDEKIPTIEPPDPYRPKPLLVFSKINQQAFEMPKFDLERRFAIDVLRMYDFDSATQKHVDLTEKRWVVNKKMFAQIPFANLKKKWEHFGLLKRANSNKNSRFMVASRTAVALVASGKSLPDWTPAPPTEDL